MKAFGMFKNLFTSKPSAEQANLPAVGDRFVSKSNKKMVWVVDRVQAESASNNPLIIMHREGHPDLCKAVSQNSLGAGGDFIRYI